MTEIELSRGPEKIIEGLANIIEQLQPEIIRNLGYIAATGANKTELSYIEGLNDAAEGLQSQLDRIFEAINEVPVRPQDENAVEENAPSEAEIAVADEVAESPETHTDTELSSQENDILAVAIIGEPVRIEQLRKTVPSIMSLSDADYEEFKKNFATHRNRIIEYLGEGGVSAHWEKLGQTRGTRYLLVTEAEQSRKESAESTVETTSAPAASQADAPPTDTTDSDLLDQIKLSPTEKIITQHIVTFLSQFEERQNIRSIISEVFGRSKLPKSEELRLVQILDQCTQAGILRSYGKTYGYKSDVDRSLPKTSIQSPNPEDSDLDETDQLLTRFIYENAQSNELHIGQIVRGVYGVKEIDRADYKNLLARLNALAQKGILIHANQSPWYGTNPQGGGSTPQVPSTKVYGHIQTPIAGQSSVVTEAITDTPKHDEATEVIEHGKEESALSDHDETMLKIIIGSVKPGEWFQRKHIELAGTVLEGETFGTIANRLIRAGLLETTGTRGGKKYRLPINQEDPQTNQVDSAKEVSGSKQTPNKGLKTQQQRHYDQAYEPKEEKPSPQAESRPLSKREQAVEFRKAARFTLKLATGITEILEATDDNKEKISVVAKTVSERLDITLPAARQMVKQMIESEYFFQDGHKKGSPMMSTTKPTENDPSSTEPLSARQAPEQKAEAQRIQELRNIYGTRILKYLSTLTKYQTEYKTAISKAVEDLDVEDVNAVCNILKAEGLLNSKEEQGRGSRRGRKGKTWSITGSGRRALQEVEGPKLTNAQKRRLSSGFRR